MGKFHGRSREVLFPIPTTGPFVFFGWLYREASNKHNLKVAEPWVMPFLGYAPNKFGRFSTPSSKRPEKRYV
jgi:hypothetical protein